MWKYDNYDSDSDLIGYSEEFLIDGDGKGITGVYSIVEQAFCIKGTDKVYSDIYSCGETKFDNTVPVIKTLVLNGSGGAVSPSNSWQPEQVYYHVTVEEPSEFSAGFKEITYTIINEDGIERPSVVINTFDTGEIYNYEFNIPSPIGEDGKYNIRIKIEDNLGMTTKKYILPSSGDEYGSQGDAVGSDFAMKVDTITPVVSISGITDGAYYNCITTPKTLKIDAQDTRSGLLDFTITATRDGGNYSDFGVNFTEGTTDAVKMKDNLDNEGVTFSEEGDYVFNVVAEDLAGNLKPLSGTISIGFTVDNTKPSLSILDDVVVISSDTGRKVFKTDRDITFSVDELHDDFSKYTVLINKNGSLYDTVNPDTDLDYDWNAKVGNISTFNYHFTEDGTYGITFTAVDLAGNSKSISATIIVDSAAPNTVISGVSDYGYYNNDVQLNVLLTDNICTTSEGTFTVTRSYREVDTNYAVSKLVADSKNYNDSRIFSEEGYYTVKINSVDEAGNAADSNIVHFTIDKTSPVLGISGTNNNSLNSTNVNLKFSYIEANSNVYNINVVRVNEDHTYQLGNLYNSSGWNNTSTLYEKEKNLVFSDEGVYTVTYSATDSAGNIADVKTISFTIDKSSPIISNLQYSNPDGILNLKFNNIYSNKYITVDFQVSDNIVGVKKVYYAVGTNGWIGNPTIYEAVHTTDNNYLMILPKSLGSEDVNTKISVWSEDILSNRSSATFTYNLIYNTLAANISMTEDKVYSGWLSEDVSFQTKVTDLKSGIDTIVYKVNNVVVKEVTFDSLVTNYEYTVTASENAPTKEGYDIEVIVKNNTGTSSSQSRRVYIDKKAPVISVSGVREGEHIPTTKVLKFNVQDVAYNETKGVVYATRTLDGVTTTFPVEDIFPNSVDSVFSRNFDLEGLYSVYFIAVDGAGNETRSNTVSFVVDKTAPVLAVTGTTKDSVNQGSVTLDFSAVESFFATNSVRIDVVKELDGVRTNSLIPGFASFAKVSALRHTFTDDGTYTVTFNGTDLAGNKAVTQTISFTIDNTPPELNFTGVTNYLVTNDTVALSSNVVESYFNTNIISINGTRIDIDGNIHTININNFSTTSKSAARVTDFSEDGIYYLKMTSIDEAGNKSEKEIHFTVDKTPPAIQGVKEIDGKYFNTFSLPEDIDEMIKDLSIVEYKIYLNGIEYDGVSPITTDGKYTLYMEVADEVGYETAAEAEFIVDHTTPKIIVDGMSDKEITHSAGNIIVSLADSEDLISDIIVNGEEVNLSKDAKTYELVYDTYGKYTMDITCIDKAGNISNESLVFYYTNLITDVTIVVVLIVFIGFVSGGFYLAIRKKARYK